jgi:ribosomal protein S18 acetylase RimI-like enzyme
MVMELEVRELAQEELAAAGGVAGRALADNPSSRWTWGDEPVHRLACSLDLLGSMVVGMPLPQLGAVVGRHVVGICAAAPPGTCIASHAPEELRTLPDSVGPPGHESRATFEWSVIAVHDPEDRHWHVGPVGVEPGLQGRGVGARLLTALGERLDRDGEVGWLETDKSDNVALYHRHGFEVTDQFDQHGLRTWFMRRDPR